MVIESEWTYLSVEQSEQNWLVQPSHSRRQHAPMSFSQYAHRSSAGSAFWLLLPLSQTAQHALLVAGSMAMACICALCFFMRAFVTAADIIRLIASTLSQSTIDTSSQSLGAW